MANEHHGNSEDRPGEGYTSERPGNEYGAGERGYPGGRDRTERPGDGWRQDAYRGDGHAYGGRRDFGAGGPGAGARIFDDLARVMTDAAGAAQGVRREVETAFRSQAETLLGRMDVVRRDEFEAMAEMAARARAECDELRSRIEALEARLGKAPVNETGTS